MNGPRYKPFDVGLLRAPILPAQCFQTLGRHFDSVSELLVTLMSEHGISEEFVTNAINAASPELFIAMQQGHSPKVVAAVRRYLVRMCTRATPFGHFAGVSIVRWASENIEPLRFDAAELRSEPNYEDVLDHLRIAEQSPTVLPTLDVCSAPTLRHMGQRFYVVSEDESGDNIRLLRRTTLLDKVFALTIHPTSVATLLGSLAHNHGFDAQRVLGIIKTLVSEGFLVTSLYSEFAREPRKVARNLSSLSPHASSANSGTVMKVALLNASGSMQQSVADMVRTPEQK